MLVFLFFFWSVDIQKMLVTAMHGDLILRKSYNLNAELGVKMVLVYMEIP